MFETIHRDDSGLRASNEIDGVPLFQTADWFLMNPAKVKGTSRAKVFYAAAKKYVNVVHGLYIQVSCANLKVFQSTDFSRLLNKKVPFTKTTSLDDYLNCRELFQTSATEDEHISKMVEKFVPKKVCIRLATSSATHAEAKQCEG